MKVDYKLEWYFNNLVEKEVIMRLVLGFLSMEDIREVEFIVLGFWFGELVDGGVFCWDKRWERKVDSLKGDEDFSLGYVNFEEFMEYLSRDVL